MILNVNLSYDFKKIIVLKLNDTVSQLWALYVQTDDWRNFLQIFSRLAPRLSAAIS